MKIAVVLVTYNRIDCLKKAICRYEKQIYNPTQIIIVDNASNDGTKEFLDEWKEKESVFEKIIIHNAKNTGGSGGFYTGMKRAMETDCDFLFLADDDAFAEEDTFLKIAQTYESMENKEEIAALCTKVINKGKIEISHRCNIHKQLCFIRLKAISEIEYEKKYFTVDLVTFVGALIKKSTIEQVGLPEKDFFIYYDDTEFFLRILHVGKTYCIPSSKMIHDTEIEKYLSWKGYYDARNWILAIDMHYPKFYTLGAVIRKYLKCSFIILILKHRSLAYRKMILNKLW